VPASSRCLSISCFHIRSVSVNDHTIVSILSKHFPRTLPFTHPRPPDDRGRLEYGCGARRTSLRRFRRRCGSVIPYRPISVRATSMSAIVVRNSDRDSFIPGSTGNNGGSTHASRNSLVVWRQPTLPTLSSTGQVEVAQSDRRID
jgi:hypothetical protein